MGIKAFFLSYSCSLRRVCEVARRRRCQTNTKALDYSMPLFFKVFAALLNEVCNLFRRAIKDTVLASGKNNKAAVCRRRLKNVPVCGKNVLAS